MPKRQELRAIPAIKVRQWLKAWDRVDFDAKQHRAKPEPHFYLFSLPAAELRLLCGIFRRETSGVSTTKNDQPKLDALLNLAIRGRR